MLMMSQSRMRKMVSNGDGGRRSRASVVKASGDTVACTGRPKQETQRSRSKNKIPKSVRYDLENALVSLCDVWFEEIKPHLVRNNIKLHVHGSSAGGDHERPPNVVPPAPPSPPVPPIRLDSDCSHLDPGAAPDRRRRRIASCVGYYSTPPTVSRVRYARLPASSHHQRLSPLPSLRQTPRDCSQNQSPNCEEKCKKRPRLRRKKRTAHPKPQSNWQVPRLCRTYSILSPIRPDPMAVTATASRVKRTASGHLHHPPRDHNRHPMGPHNQVKSKSTQTEATSSGVGNNVGSQWWVSGPGLRPRRPVSSSPAAPAAPKSHQNRSKGHRSQRTDNKPVKEPPLFQEDLINVIGEKHTKRLKLLHSSNAQDDYSSVMNLVPWPAKPGGLKKIVPWR